MADKIFVEGMNCRVPSDKAQHVGFVTKLGINVEKFYKWAKQYEDEKGWVNIDVMLSKKTADHYAALNEWKPEQRPAVLDKPMDEMTDLDVPF